MRRALPFLEVGIVLGVMLVTGLLQGVVEKESVFFINVNWSQVGASAKPPLLRAWNTQKTQEEGNKSQPLFTGSMVPLTPAHCRECHTLTIFLLNLKVSVVEVHGGDVGVLWVNDRTHTHGTEWQLTC